MRKLTGIIIAILVYLTFTASPIKAQTLPGDVNSDGKVDIVDIGLIIDHYGDPASTYPRADINSDGQINIVDIGLTIDNYGRNLNATPAPTSTGNLGGAVWHADADTRGMGAWKSIQCPSGACDVTDDPLGRYGKVYRFTLNTGETYSGDGNSRAEVYGAKLTNGQILDFYEGDEYYLGFRTLVSNGIHTNNGNSGNFFQLKGDSSCSGPAVGLTMNQGLLTLRTELYGIMWRGPEMANYTGTWHDMVVHVYFSKDPNKGYVEAWLDGVPQTFVDGTRRYYEATMCPNDEYIYLKMGYYRGSHTEYPSGTHWIESPRLGPTYESVVPR